MIGRAPLTEAAGAVGLGAAEGGAGVAGGAIGRAGARGGVAACAETADCIDGRRGGIATAGDGAGLGGIADGCTAAGLGGIEGAAGGGADDRVGIAGAAAGAGGANDGGAAGRGGAKGGGVGLRPGAGGPDGNPGGRGMNTGRATTGVADDIAGAGGGTAMGPPPVCAGAGALGVGAEGVAACGMTGVGAVPKFGAVRGTDDGVNSSAA